jgi:hypothetical protein
MHPCSVRVAIPRPVIALALALLAGALLPAARGQIPFEEPYVFAGVNLNGVALGDADGDGNSDLFASASFGSVRVLLGSGDGHFDTSFHVVNGFSTAFDVADLDGDGRDDVVTVGNLNGLQVWLAVGGGDYVGPTDVPVSGVPHSVEAVDLDGDGDLDLVVGLANGLSASIAIGDGDGGFAPVADVQVPDGHDRIRTGDLNGDGLVDLVSWHFQAAVELGLDSARFAAPVTVFTGSVSDLDVGDINRDGADDLAIEGSSNVLVYGQVGGLPQPAVPLGFGLSSSKLIRIADVDGNSHPDLALGTTSLVGVSLQQEGGVFGASSALLLAGAGTNLVGMAFGDIDHDGTLDLVTADSGADVVTVHTGQGDGGFRPAYGPDAVGGVLRLAAADFDVDGRLDLFATSAGILHPLRRGLFDSSFADAVDVSIGLQLSSRPDVSDANGDGKPDLAAYSSGSFTSPAKVSLTLGNGDLSFGPPAVTTVASSSAVGDFVDFDGDGRTDLVLVGETGGNQLRLSRMANTGVSFVLDFTMVFPSPGAPGPVVVADLDEDGTLDVVVNCADAGLHWLEGFENDGYAGPVPLAGLPALDDFTLADLDGDGHLDLVGIAANADTLLVALGAGDTSFGTPTLIPLPAAHVGMRVDDIDGDGILDVAVATVTFPPPVGIDGAVNIYRGQGGGQLALAGSVQIATQVRDLLFADTNLDGAKDLVVVQGDQTLVLLNQDGPWNNLGHPLPGAAGYSGLVGEGTLQPSTPLTIAIHDGPPLAPIVFVVGTSAAMIPFKGGTLVPQPLLVIPAGTTNGLGALKLGGSWPASVPSGASLFLQAWLVDAGGPAGFSATNALSGTTP